MVLEFQLHCEFDEFDRARLFQEIRAFSLSTKKVHTRNPKYPFFHYNTHQSSGIMALGTILLICNPCTALDYACLCMTPGQLLLPGCPWSKYFTVWYPCERYLSYAWTIKLSILETCRIWFFGMWGDFSYFLTLSTNSYPWVRRRGRVFLNNWKQIPEG